MTDKESMKYNYTLAMCSKIQELSAKRAQKFTQVEMAHKLDVSLKTIQNFEAFRTFDSWMIWGYREILK